MNQGLFSIHLLQDIWGVLWQVQKQHSLKYTDSAIILPYYISQRLFICHMFWLGLYLLSEQLYVL